MENNTLILVLFLIFFVIAIVSFSNSGSTNLTAPQNVRLMHHKHVKLSSVDTVEKSIDERILPSSYDCWNSNVLVIDQGPWGACTAFSLRYAYLTKLANANQSLVEPSTAFLYDKARLREGNTSLSDTGATNTDVAYIVQNVGIPPSNNFPYTGFNVFNAPPSNIAGLTKYNMTNLSMSNTTSVNVVNFKNIIKSNKGLIVAFLVYPSMMTTNVLVSGIIPQPGTREQVIGGHSIMLSGWNDSTKRFIFRNSWGTYTGSTGLYTIPYNYIANANYAGDVWYFTN